MSDAAADKPRVVVEYAGVQLRDSRESIQLHFTIMPIPRGMRWCMKDCGFKPSNGGKTWIKPHSPSAIFDAQNLASTFFTQEKS